MGHRTSTTRRRRRRGRSPTRPTATLPRRRRWSAPETSMALSIRCTTTSRSEVHHSTISPHGVVRYEPTIVPDHITRNLEGHGTNLSQALSSVCWESVCDRACVPCRCTAPVYPLVAGSFREDVTALQFAIPVTAPHRVKERNGVPYRNIERDRWRITPPLEVFRLLPT